MRAAVNRFLLLAACQLFLCAPMSWAADASSRKSDEDAKPILSVDCQYGQWRSRVQVTAAGKAAIELVNGKGSSSVCELRIKHMSFCDGRCRHTERVAFYFERLSCHPEIEPEAARALSPQPWLRVTGDGARQFWWTYEDEWEKTTCQVPTYDDAGIRRLDSSRFHR